MKNRNLRFNPHAVQHVYQKANDGGVVFYDDLDRIVYFSISSVMARRYGIVTLGLSIMITHLHESVIANNQTQFSRYVQAKTSTFARAYNYRRGRRGVLFRHRFGSASRKDAKKIRELLAYQYNNHVEKGLCKHPVEARWCFLAYAKSNCPFSTPIDPGNISEKLNNALKFVARKRKRDEYLRYSELEKIMNGLSVEEVEQLKDYIITQYLFIDFHKAISFYNSFEDMLMAFDSNTGSERVINEEYSSFSDQDYVKLNKIFEKRGWSHNMIFTMPKDKLRSIAVDLYITYNIDKYAIKKYFHL